MLFKWFEFKNFKIVDKRVHVEYFLRSLWITSGIFLLTILTSRH